MSKVKRILSVIMAMVMVLAMSIPTFAAGQTATVTLKNFKDADKVEYLQIIATDQSTTSGWKFVNNAGKCFTDALGTTKADATAQKEAEQQAIWGLIKYVNKDLVLPEGVTATTVTAADIDVALSSAKSLTGYVTVDNKESFTVDKAGVYAIKAEETGYTYKTMSAYVSFTYAANETVSGLDDTEVSAKKAETTVNKDTTDADHVVAVGDIVEYTIEVFVPYIDANETDRTFSISDKISGAEYYLNGENSVNSVTMEGSDDQVGVIEAKGTGFAINLNSLVADKNNPNAGKKITVRYTVKVTDTNVENNATSHVSNSTYDSKPVKLFTGEITMTKYAEDETTKLAGAGFKVKKEGTDGFLKFTQEKDGIYSYDENGEEEVFTGTDGTVTLIGLDQGTYTFEETTAPEGYSVNKEKKTATITLKEGKEKAEAQKDVVNGETSIKDTKLNSLPSTGGIGTTIFTIGGCAIMIVAAGLFFATRRKTQK